jgi:biopolymer transport protein ExbD
MAKLEDVSEDEGVLASINIIPFVDIVLVLLVIFMLTSATIVKAQLKVDLPKAATGGSRVNTTLNLVLSREGKLSDR